MGVRHCKKRQTKHSLQRCLERTDLGYKDEALRLIKEASRSGLSPDKLEDEQLSKKLMHKQIKAHKRIKVYKGYIFIFNKNSDRCITMYKIEKKVENNGK